MAQCQPGKTYRISPPVLGLHVIERDCLTDQCRDDFVERGREMLELMNTPLKKGLESIQSQYIELNYEDLLGENHWERTSRPDGWTIMSQQPSPLTPAFRSLGLSSEYDAWLENSWKFNFASFFRVSSPVQMTSDNIYSALFNPQAILVDLMFAPRFDDEYENKAQLPNLRHWSDFAFLEWQTYSKRGIEKSTVLEDSSLQADNTVPYPRYIILSNITNALTLGAWGTVFGMQKAAGFHLMKDKLSWKDRIEVSSDDGDAYHMLMGTPVMKAVAWFLISHKAQFGDAVKVNKIALWNPGEGDVSLCIWIGE